MSNLKVFKELTLPQTLELNSIYYIVDTLNPVLAEIYITGNVEGVVKHILNKTDVAAIVKVLENSINSKLDLKPNINCFKHADLSKDGAFLYEATTTRGSDGIAVATMLTTKLSSIFYDYEVDGRIFVIGQKVTFEVEMMSDAISSNGGDISLVALDVNGSNLGTIMTTRGTVKDLWEHLTVSLVLPVGAAKLRFRFIRRTANTYVKFRKPVAISDAWDSKYVSVFNTPAAPVANSFYVAKTGSDTNIGSIAQPFLTIQKAVNAAINTNTSSRITILDSGWYRETVSVTTDVNIELTSTYNQRAAIVGSTQLVVTKTAGMTKVYQAPLTNKPIGMGGGRGEAMIFELGTPYSPIIDEDVHTLQRGSTHRCNFTPMFEVESLAVLDTETGNGKWWWENGVIYFSAVNGGDATLKQYEARFRSTFVSNNNMVMKRLDSYFSTGSGFTFNGASVVRDDCAVYGAYSNGFSDSTNSTISRRDIAVLCGNDGFNGTPKSYVGLPDPATRIDADYFDPYAALNGDDGISYHSRGLCNIWGGLLEYNTKAGVVHVTGAGGNCYGTISRGQINGFYTATASIDSDRNISSMHCHGTIAERNQYDYRAADNAELHCINTRSINPTGFGYYQTGSGELTVSDGKYRGDPAKVKSGNIIVHNDQTVV